MGELGLGDELMRPEDYDLPSKEISGFADNDVDINSEAAQDMQKTISEIQTLHALPIVIIKNFATKHGKDEVLDVLANWAASLVINKAAHVLVVSDNRENAKVLAQGLFVCH